MNKQHLSHLIKNKALELGFLDCRFSEAMELTHEARILENWLNQNKHGQMLYMANHFEKRIDPRKLVNGAKSVISLSYNYFTKQQQTTDAPKLAMYSYGEDYHVVVKEKAEDLLSWIKEQAGDVTGRCFVDSAPVLERAWAQRSGLGWIGKNTNLLTKQKGSFFFLAEIICDLQLDYDSPVKDYCGTCTKCIDACPTGAIDKPYEVDGSKCISYFTIELKDEILPSEMKGKFENWMFGCDICQRVCPINSQSTEHNEPRFDAHQELLLMNRRDWENLNEETFNRIFKKSPVKRTKFKGLKRNINFLESLNQHDE
ncbi:MAG: tRNA epoxyqueuosine(34) reductase QueG [Chitinophagales bacterium]|nr:tRNA epoxyqueuosine(34) reductase QueG [Chitinophagales bacterium]